MTETGSICSGATNQIKLGIATHPPEPCGTNSQCRSNPLLAGRARGYLAAQPPQALFGLRRALSEIRSLTAGFAWREGPCGPH